MGLLQGFPHIDPSHYWFLQVESFHHDPSASRLVWIFTETLIDIPRGLCGSTPQFIPVDPISCAHSGECRSWGSDSCVDTGSVFTSSPTYWAGREIRASLPQPEDGSDHGRTSVSLCLEDDEKEDQVQVMIKTQRGNFWIRQISWMREASSSVLATSMTKSRWEQGSAVVCSIPF